MISTSTVIKLIEEKIAETAIFIVDVSVSSSNHIAVEIDSPEGVNVKDCLMVSRQIEGNLDREVEDYSLEVTSPGLDQSLKIVPQYLKNIGRQVKVKTLEGTEIEGTLTAASDTGFEVTSEEKVRLEGKKKKELVTTVHPLEYDKVKSTYIIISFK